MKRSRKVFTMLLAVSVLLLMLPAVVHADALNCWSTYVTNVTNQQVRPPTVQDCISATQSDVNSDVNQVKHVTTNAVGFGAGAFTVMASALPHTLMGSFNYQVEPAGVGQVLIVWNCQAVATPDAASTGIDDCSVGGTPRQQALNAPNNYPGDVSVAVGEMVWTLGASPPSGCIQVHAQFIEGSLGLTSLATTPTCRDLVIVHT